MSFFLALITVLIFGGCSTFQQNEKALRNACKAGVEQYDDGTVNFSCFKKEVVKPNDKN